jgi:hypothetical protein
MKVIHIVCAILACASLSVEARATASTEDGGSSPPAANAGQAAGTPAPSRDASAKPVGARDSEPNRTRARSGSTGRASKGNPSQGGGSKGSASKGRDAAGAVSPRRGSATPAHSAAQTGVAQAGRSNADRLHSLLNAKAHGRLVRQPGRTVGSTRDAVGGPSVRGPSPSVVSAGQPKLAAANSAPAPAAGPATTPRSPAIGGPHAQGSGRVGGPAVSRTTRNATVDGAQLRHKF